MKSKCILKNEGGLIRDLIPQDIVNRYEKIPTRVYPSESEAQSIATSHKRILSPSQVATAVSSGKEPRIAPKIQLDSTMS
ncbi:MAG: hypothetical protein SNI51_01545 [Rikenellaceae bacterium]